MAELHCVNGPAILTGMAPNYSREGCALGDVTFCKKEELSYIFLFLNNKVALAENYIGTKLIAGG
jgi:hypothetical protein